ncbi:MAG: hypothetical protein HRT57_04230, partial [Crocinitomicaceae bacterium]|nr:hypothetical protein [Crocinitomicaceae bacterium]
MKRPLYFVIALGFIVFGCNESSETNTTDKEELSQKEPAETPPAQEEEESAQDSKELKLRSDWEQIKMAIIEGDTDALST